MNIFTLIALILAALGSGYLVHRDEYSLKAIALNTAIFGCCVRIYVFYTTLRFHSQLDGIPLLHHKQEYVVLFTTKEHGELIATIIFTPLLLFLSVGAVRGLYAISPRRKHS